MKRRGHLPRPAFHDHSDDDDHHHHDHHGKKKSRRKKTPVCKYMAIVFTMTVVWIFAAPSRITSQAFYSAPRPKLEGPLARNNLLVTGSRTLLKRIPGPEGVAVDNAGHVYTGAWNGSIWEITTEPRSVREVCFTGGRPFGMMVDPRPSHENDLIVCDGTKGLLRVDTQTGAVDVLADYVDGLKVRFGNDLHITEDGVVYFTDSSTMLDARSKNLGAGLVLEQLKSSPHGRLLSFDLRTNASTTIARDLYFPNGVTECRDSEGNRFLLVSETFRYRILRVYISGPKAGSPPDVFIDNTPGFPDGVRCVDPSDYMGQRITEDQGQLVFVSFHSPRKFSSDFADRRPWIKDRVSSLPLPILSGFSDSYGLVVVYKNDQPITSFHDPDSRIVHTPGSIVVKNGWLYIGSDKGFRLTRFRL